jgi:hypothetical protein
VITFTDVLPTDYFYEPVRYLFCAGVISGYADNTFRPYNTTTRGQMTKIVVLAFGYTLYTPATPTFSDTPADHPFYVFVETAAANNIVAGYDDGTFRPCANVTRGQLSKIVVIAAAWPNINPPEQTFNDVPPDHPFYTFIETAACHGIISGYADGSFRPFNDATRAQIAKIVCLAMRDEVVCAEPETPTPGTQTPAATRTPTALPTLCPGGVVVTGSIDNNDSGQVSAVVGGISSQCGVTQACPGMSGIPGTRHYDSYTYTNTTGSTLCVTVSVDALGCERSGVGSVAYIGSFDPNNVCSNYAGHTSTAGPQFRYSFSVPAGATYIVVVRELSPGIGCASYTLRVSPCDQASLPTFTPTRTGTPAPPTSTRTATLPPTSTATPGGPTATATLVCQGVTYSVTTATATMIPATNDIGNHCDDCTTDLTLPFPVTVYGTPVSSVRVGSNSAVQFVASSTKPFFFDECVPVDPSQGGPYEHTLFAYYDDMLTTLTTTQPCATCGIYTATVGTAPNRQFVIRWETTYFNHSGTANFEVVLTEGSGVISVIYGPNANNGAEAASGIQKDLTVFTSYSCDTPTLTPGLRVNYVPQGCDQSPYQYIRRY